MELSILISSRDRLKLFRRSLWGIANRPPSVPFEVVVADDGSTEPISEELAKYSFPSTFISVDMGEFTRRTGVSRFWNCPALTNNVAWRHASGKYLAQMGNEIIPVGSVFDDLLAGLGECVPPAEYAWAVSTTFDVPPSILADLDEYGTNLTDQVVQACSRWRLDNGNNVPNYLSVFTRSVWTALAGYDERYLAGISAEDSDFMRRAFSLGLQVHRSQSVGLHQNHGGVSHFQRPLPELITEERLAEGVAINRKLYQAWDDSVQNGQPWPAGTIGIKDVVRRNY